MRGLLPATLAFWFGGVAAHPLQAQVLDCQPALPFYCANIHVGCSGKSRLATAQITLLFHSNGVEVSMGSADWLARASRHNGYIVLRPLEGGRDWIRLQRNGQFSQRIYRFGGALMTRGKCKKRER